MKLIFGLFSFLAGSVLMFFGGFFVRDALAGMPPSMDSFSRLQKGSASQLTPSEAFQEQFDFIENNFGRDLEREDLLNGALSGVVSSLGDPHTNFLEPEISEQFTTETRGDFVGVGARLSDDPLGARIFSVFPNGPAKAKGLKAGDLISKVDGRDVAGMDTEKIVTFIRGEEGTAVKLTVIREGASSPIVFEVMRAKVEIPTVDHKVINGKVGYVQVTNFAGPTAEQFGQALVDMKNGGAKGLIIDMRSNPGGLLSSAIDMLSFFVDSKPVVTMKGRGGQSTTATTRYGQVLNWDVPIAILINEDSASAAEIFAGVMRDYKKGTLVGSHTYGKASVQDLFPLPDGASAKITIAKYFLPSGEDISRTQDDDGQYVSGGLRPEIPVEFEFNADTQFGVPGKDTQLDKALQFLSK